MIIKNAKIFDGEKFIEKNLEIIASVYAVYYRRNLFLCGNGA